MPFQRDPEVFFTQADGELIIMAKTGEMFLTANTVGGVIWERLEEPATPEQLCELVLVRFAGADRAQVAIDVPEFIDSLRARDLVQETAAG